MTDFLSIKPEAELKSENLMKGIKLDLNWRLKKDTGNRTTTSSRNPTPEPYSTANQNQNRSSHQNYLQMAPKKHHTNHHINRKLGKHHVNDKTC